MSAAKQPRFAPAVVVGGGPIGIETAVALRAAGVDALVVEAGTIGHTISWWAPHTRWFSSNDRIAIAGVPLTTVDQSKASREEYLNYLRAVVDQFQVPVKTFTRVESIEPVDSGEEGATAAQGESARPLYRLRLNKIRADSHSAWKVRTQPAANQTAGGDIGVETQSHETIVTPCVVLAIGGTDHPNRLGVPGEELPHVDGYLREIHRYYGRDVLVVGGRNSAVEGAIRLHRGGARVSLSYHGESLPNDSIKYWLRPEMEGLISSGAIRSFFHTRVRQIGPDHVVLQSTVGGADVRVRADDVLTLIGYRQDDSLWKCLGIEQIGPGGAPQFNPETMETKLPGVYVAGTAVGGTQSSKYQVFLENCHPHAERITRHVVSNLIAGNEQTVRGESDSSRPHSGLSEPSAEALQRRIELQPES